MSWAIEEKGYSQRRACRLVGLEPKTYRYASTRPDDGALRAAAEGIGFGTTPVRLPAPAPPAASEGRRDEPEEALPALSRGTADGAQAWRPQAGAGNTGADGDPAGPQPALVARLRVGHAGQRPAVPDADRGRRLQPGMPGPGRRHLALRPACRPRTRSRHRDARLPLHGGQRQRHRVDLARHPGLAGRKRASNGTTSRRASRRRTASSKASMAGCATSA